MRPFLLALLAVPLPAALVGYGNLSSSNSNVTCVGGSSHPEADCRVEYASNATMPVNNFAYIVQASAGNRATTSTAEMNILNFAGSASGASIGTGQWAWANNTTYKMTVAYTASTRAIVYTLLNEATSASTTVNATLPSAQSINDVFFRTQAITANSSITLSNLTVNGYLFSGAISHAQASLAAQQIQYFWVSGLDNANFTVSANILMSWNPATPPSGTNLVSYLKFGTVQNPQTYVPEPGTMALEGCGLALLIWAEHRRRSTRKPSR